MSDTLSPEERLFKVIQQGKRTAGQVPGGVGKKTGGWSEKFKRFITPQLAGKAVAEWEKAVRARIKWPEPKPENINKVLAVILGVALVLAVYAALNKHKDVAVITDAAARSKASPEEGKKIEPLKDLSFYLSAMRKRDLFHASEMTPGLERVQNKSEPIVKAPENLKLQGISWGDVPKAMILWQSGKESKMYFLVEGQALGTTGFVVTKISKSTVTVNDGKEDTVLL